MNSKRAFRQQVFDLRKAQDPEQVKRWNDRIRQQVLETDMYKNAKSILIYASCNGEPDTYGIMGHAMAVGKTVAVPRVISKGVMEFIEIKDIEDLEPGFKGIPEPKKTCTKAVCGGLMIMPGVCFDQQGNRIGYGGGYYDRYLQEHGSDVCTCAIGFSFQMFEALPAEVHDRKPDKIITNNHNMEFS